jgi:hypothetical protein
MKGTIKRGLFAAVAMLMGLSGGSPVAHASTGSGQIVALRLSTGVSPARVSVRMPGNTSCGNNGWYAFESADTGLGKVWQDALLAAHMNARPVTIVGTGTCDQFQVEKINYIDFN